MIFNGYEMIPEALRKSRLQVLDWAQTVIASRPPDFIVGAGQLDRWFILPRNDVMNVYLHSFNASDEDRALHDHPYDNRSWILSGSYVEHLQDGRRVQRFEGEVIERKAVEAHRVELFPSSSSSPSSSSKPSKPSKPITLFFTGPRIRQWGFYCPQGWRPWDQFIDPSDYGSRSQKGRGCGD